MGVHDPTEIFAHILVAIEAAVFRGVNGIYVIALGKGNGTEVIQIGKAVLLPLLQGMLELVKIPVVGCGSASSAVCMDKAFTKRVLNAEGIPQAPAAIITYEEYLNLCKENKHNR